MLQVFLSRAVATESKQRHELLNVLPVAFRAESLGIRTGRRWTSKPFKPKLTRPAFILVNGHLPYLLRLTALPTWHARHSGGFAHVAHIERQFNPGLWCWSRRFVARPSGADAKGLSRSRFWRGKNSCGPLANAMRRTRTLKVNAARGAHMIEASYPWLRAAIHSLGSCSFPHRSCGLITRCSFAFPLLQGQMLARAARMRSW